MTRSTPRPSPLHAWQGLSAAQQRTAAAALVLFASLLTPWYATKVVFAGRPPQVSEESLSGFAAFSFVEAAVLLVAVAVLVLTWARATERRFSLPFADGTLVTAGGAWIGALIVYRLFDRPDGTESATSTTLVGLSWGIFASLAAAGLLLATGLDQRRAAAERAARAREDRAAAEAERPVVDPRDVVDAPRRRPDDRAPRAADGRPREAPGTPAGRPRPARRPAGHADDTRHVGRDDAAELLRDAGLGAEADDAAATRPPTPRGPAPRVELGGAAASLAADGAPGTRGGDGAVSGQDAPTRPRRADEAPTRALPDDEAPTRAAAAEDAPTRAVPRDGAATSPPPEHAPGTDETRVHPERRDERRRPRWRR
ncbi:hypothetical protein [Patulibacter sp. SYSU D01012]|uniref:hypothetical protein n=1 Tax=Patulibacter sp. SYSU D01012 TaxID=2817381 RepID=UPI001B3083BD|nr:hypothetical protein [Patulibacter sp. SYSU D01012]